VQKEVGGAKEGRASQTQNPRGSAALRIAHPVQRAVPSVVHDEVRRDLGCGVVSAGCSRGYLWQRAQDRR
jgi:hypothetical protein